MNKWIMKQMMISCKDATYMASQEEEHKLGFFQRIKWKMHLRMCKVCQDFANQNELIGSLYESERKTPVNETLKEDVLKKITEN